MNRFKMFIAKRFFKELLPQEQDKSGSTGGATGRELASSAVSRLVYKDNSDTSWEDPSFDLESIQTAYNTDSYIRQGVDKYVDQIFKEGYSFYGPDSNVVDYIKLRIQYIAEATQTPTGELLTGIAEDLVKYGNCMVVKTRSNDPNAFPQGVNLQGLDGKDPVAGYFFANAVSMKCTRDDYGTVTKWQQDNDKGQQEFDPQDVIHFFYKREKGNAYGTSFLVPVLPDVAALRQAEENVLKMMFRNIYPFYHIQVGTEETPGTKAEVDSTKEEIGSQDLEGMLISTERVNVKPIASDQVIDAEPYLKYMESRVFSGLGIPEIMFGRGNTANRSTGDNMTSEMSDRIRAIQRIMEMFINQFMIKELLMEGGYDPILNPDQVVEFRFTDNDVDVEIKKQVHAIYKYEHNAITEDEMRNELGMDPIPDGERSKMFVELITRETARQNAQLSQQNQQASGENSSSSSNKKSSTGSGETNNKEKNQGGKPRKSSSDFIEPATIGIVKDITDDMEDKIDKYLKECCDSKSEILQTQMLKYITDSNKEILAVISKDCKNTKRIQNKLAQLATDLVQGINQDLIGYDIYNPLNIIDVLNVRIDIFRDMLVKYLVE